ncbi:MAG: hypothetical protein H0U58_07895 [Chloroflexi bacterium]|nr:hypothetical protein [Chloroflexota bacterium]
MAIVVDQPIIDSPFDQPTRHHRVLEGAPDVIETRRPSGYMPPGDDPGPD